MIANLQKNTIKYGKKLDKEVDKLEIDSIKALIKKVRKWCIIASIIIFILGIGLTVFKVYFISSSASSGISEINNQPSDPEGAGMVFNTFLGIGVAGLAGIAVVGFIVIGLIKVFAGIAIVWMGFLIFYLVQRSKIKKLKTQQMEVQQPVQENQINS